jgi:pyruvate dehydrogenase E1 component alpha subunit
MMEHDILTEKGITDIERAVKEEIEEADRFALESPDPDPEEALDDIFV